MVVYWMHFIYNRNRKRAVVHTVINFRVP